MERLYSGIIQILIAVIKIVVLMVFPLVSFVVPLIGIPIPGVALRGIRMFNTGNMLILIPMLTYLAMVLLSIGPIQKFSCIAAAVALIVELVFMLIAPTILNSGDVAFLMSLIPAEYRTYIEMGLYKLAVPGWGLYVNLGLTIVYIIWYWVSGTLFGNNRSTKGGGYNSGSRPNVTGKSAQPSGGINRPRI